MAVYSPISTRIKNMLSFAGSSHRHMSNSIYDITSRGPSHIHCFHICTGRPKYTSISAPTANSWTSMGSQASRWSCLGSIKQKSGNYSFKIDCIVNSRSSCKTSSDIFLRSQMQNMKWRRLVHSRGNLAKTNHRVRPGSGHQSYGLAGILIGMFVCYASFERAQAEAPDAKNNQEGDSDPSSARYSHGKKVYTDYSVTGIPGDGRCLFRSVAHGASLRSGKPIPDEILQRQLADELRAKVADEFIKRREETEWFIEGDFDTYVAQIRKPHVWGGEPELLMASHVLQMPITVYMYDQDSGGLISIAEYGQEYGKNDPIRVLYHGFGHYDALQIPGKKGARSRL